MSPRDSARETHFLHAASSEQRLAAGREMRRRLSRRVQGEWTLSPKRPPLLDLLRARETGRLPKLLPLKYGRMAVSPFSFYRGMAPMMAWDLAHTPVSGLSLQICGDAHLRNLGAFAGPEGHILFDLNDFDETTPGPWEWDLKRLTASVALAGREAGASDFICKQAVRELTAVYRTSLARFAEMPVLTLARWTIRRAETSGPLSAVFQKAARATPVLQLKRLTTPGKGLRPPRFRSEPPLLAPLGKKDSAAVIGSLRAYRDTLGPARQLVFDSYRPSSAAFKVVGTGSVGLRNFVVLCFGAGPHDPLFMQIKQAARSCYAPWLAAARRVAHEGRRVAEGQHRMQTASDLLLGWTTIAGRPYLVRQLSDHKAAIAPEVLHGEALIEYARVCGELLAKGHARTGDALALAAYCGRSERLDEAIARFALAYAEQTEKDFANFKSLIKSGLLQARKVAAPVK